MHNNVLQFLCFHDEKQLIRIISDCFWIFDSLTSRLSVTSVHILSSLQVLGAGSLPVRGPVYVSPLTGGADGVAEALRITPHPPQTAAGEQTFHRELHGDSDREVDELPLTGESGECTQV